MPEVKAEIAGQVYSIGCGDGEEDHLKHLTARIDHEATRLRKDLGQIEESRLMLLSALVIADRLSEMETRAQTAEAEADAARREAENYASQLSAIPAQEADIAEGLDNLAERIQNLAERLEKEA